jgi:hypothetical protein
VNSFAASNNRLAAEPALGPDRLEGVVAPFQPVGDLSSFNEGLPETADGLH